MTIKLIGYEYETDADREPRPLLAVACELCERPTGNPHGITLHPGIGGNLRIRTCASCFDQITMLIGQIQSTKG